MFSRSALLVLLLAAALRGEERPPPPEVVEAIGAAEWGGMPPWRQRIVLHRFGKLQEMPPERRERVLAGGLREYLLKPDERIDFSELPAAIREEAERLPGESRARVGRLLLLRWRQLQLDRALERVPDRAERRERFRRLFPEPFDPGAAAAAHRDLRERSKRLLVETLIGPRLEALEQESGRRLTKEERIEAAGRLLEEEARREEAALVDRLREEVLRRREILGPGGERMRLLFLEKLESFATPRERELIRYILRPRECPLLDLSFLGPPPSEPAERHLYEEDLQRLARLDLLAETALPTEMILHLADTHSPEDFLRAWGELRGGRPPRRRGPG